MRFILLARDHETATVRLVSPAVPTRDAALSGIADIAPGELSGTDLFLVDLDSVAPVVVYERDVPAEPLGGETVTAWETGPPSSLLEPVEDESVTEGPAASETGLADALRRAASAMESQGVVPAPTVEDVIAAAPLADEWSAGTLAESDVEAAGLGSWDAEPAVVEIQDYIIESTAAPDDLAAELDALAMVAAANMAPSEEQGQPAEEAAEPFAEAEPAEPAETMATGEDASALEDLTAGPTWGLPEQGLPELGNESIASQPEITWSSEPSAWPWESGEPVAQPVMPASEATEAADGSDMSGDVADDLYAPPMEVPAAETPIDSTQPDDDFMPRPVILGEYASSTAVLSEASEEAAPEPAEEPVEAPSDVQAEPLDAESEAEAPAPEPMAAEPETATDALASEPIDDFLGITEPPFTETPVKGYEPRTIDMGSYTCDDCVYTTTCPKAGQDSPSSCGSFQWKSV